MPKDTYLLFLDQEVIWRGPLIKKGESFVLDIHKHWGNRTLIIAAH